MLLAWSSLDASGFSLAPTLAAKQTSFASHLTSNPKKNSVTLTYLEINGWLLSMGGITVLIDPLLEGPLDFGIPGLYKGNKRILPSSGITESLPPIDCLLITQGLDDHAHVRTLRKLKTLDPLVPIVAAPSAKSALKASGFFDSKGRASNIKFLDHGKTTTIAPRDGPRANKESAISIRATEGALVGPPWQRRENGYILGGDSSKSPSVYIEPHVEFNRQELARLGPVDVVISPISGQGLPAFELVHGSKDTVRLLETLKPKYLVPMQNGDIDTEGAVSKLVSELGSPEEFQERFAASGLTTKVLDVTPGQDFVVSV